MKNQKLFVNCFLHIKNLDQILKILKKRTTLIVYVYSILRTSKNVLRYLSKNSHFRRPFDKHYGKRSQILSKSVRQHPYHNFSSLWRNLSLRKSLFVICKILGLFVNTLTANDKYSLVNRDILTQPIEVYWSKKPKKLKNLFLHFGNKDQIFESNGDPHSLCISDITDCETRGSSNELKALFQKTLRQATC